MVITTGVRGEHYASLGATIWEGALHVGVKVVVIGGRYGGAAMAKALDEWAGVVLMEPKDTCVRNAMLR